MPEKRRHKGRHQCAWWKTWTQPPQDEWLGTQPPQDQRPAAPRIAAKGEISSDRDDDTGGNEKVNHWWTTEVKAPPVYLFQANPGAFIEMPENLRPTFFFEVFLNDKVIEFFIVETNSYAKEVCQNMVIKRGSRFRKWEPRNATEIRMFIGLVLHMGVINLPRVSDYWSNNPLYKTYLWSKCMSRNHF